MKKIVIVLLIVLVLNEINHIMEVLRYASLLASIGKSAYNAQFWEGMMADLMAIIIIGWLYYVLFSRRKG